MKLPQMPKFGEVFESFSLVLKEYKKSRKYEHTQKCDVIVVYPTGLGEYYQGKTDETNSFLYVPILQRVYADENGLSPILIGKNKLFVVSSEYHGTINLIEMGKIATGITHNSRIRIKVTDSFKKLVSAYWKYQNDVIDIEVSNIPNTIQVNLFNNRWSVSLSAASFLILSTKNLSWLEEPTRIRFLLSCALTGVIGMLIGAFFSFLGSLIFFWWIK